MTNLQNTYWRYWRYTMRRQQQQQLSRDDEEEIRQGQAMEMDALKAEIEALKAENELAVSLPSRSSTA